jgi:hypothetical protein
VKQAGLAESGVSGDTHDLTAVLFGARGGLPQRVQLERAADERNEVRCGRRTLPVQEP